MPIKKRFRLDSLAESGGWGFVVIGRKGKIAWANRAFCRMLGQEETKIFGKPLARLLLPKDRRRALTFLDKARRNPRESLIAELRFAPLQGREIVLLAAAAGPVSWGDRKKNSALFFFDDSPLKKKEEKLGRALRKRETLLREIHHRVKNNIQLISSLLRIQAGAIEDEKIREILRASQSRVQTISLLHERLLQSRDLATVDLGDYIRTISGYILQLSGTSPARVRLDVTAPRGLRLEARRAVPCGLIANELILNAVKHAFPKGKAGRITVDLSSAGGRTALIVSDDGVGLPPEFDIEKPQSLGLQIVADLVKEIDGKMEVGRRAGTTFKIVF